MEKRSFGSEDTNSVTVTAVKGKVSAEGILKNESDPEVNCLAVSQTQRYFAVGTSNGFEIIQNDSNMSVKKLKKNVVLNESVVMIEMMYKSNFIALVFEKDRNKVIIWDDYEERTRTEVSFHSEVRCIRLSKEHLVVVLDEKVFVFNFENLKCIDQIETIENPNGIVALSQGEKPINRVVVCPHEYKGMLKVHIFVMDKSIENIVTAHESEIGALTVNAEGTLIASASTKGTLIRILSVEGGEQLQELRRGTGKAVIHNLIFHPTLNLLAC
jgi:WD40 repeat protein